MPDKKRERYYLSRLRACVPDLPAGDPIEPEPPDFVLIKDGHRLGIELTTFYLPPEPGKRPHQERQSLKERIVAEAAALHSQAGGPALYVRSFSMSARSFKRGTSSPFQENWQMLSWLIRSLNISLSRMSKFLGSTNRSGLASSGCTAA